MNIAVCVKPVPDPEKYSDLKINPETKRLERQGVSTVLNPSDKNALEEALKLKESNGGTVIVVSMSPEFSKDKIVEALAMGADSAYLLSDRVYGGADTYATSYVLANAIKEIEKECELKFELILCGNESADGATSHVPSQTAECLGLPHICNVCEMSIDGKSIEASKKGDGEILKFTGKLPAVIAVSRDINKPRFVNAMGIIKARKKTLTIWSNDKLKLDETKIGLPGSPTQAGELILPDMSRKAEPIEGEIEAVADTILAIIRKAGV